MRLVALILWALHSLALAQPIVIDGQHNDWPSQHASITDPAGDAAGELDVIELGGLAHGNIIYLRLRTTSLFNFVAGAQTDPDLRIVFQPDGGPVLELSARGRQLVRRDTAQVLTWDAVKYASAPTFASDTYEFRLDLSSVGGIGPAGVTVWLEGSDTLESPLTIPAGKSSGTGANPPRVTITPGTPGSTPAIEPDAQAPIPARHLRVASLNTYQTGLLDNSRIAVFGRLLRSTAADIILIQEEYNSNATQVASFFNTHMPRPDGATWNVHKRGDNAIVSHYPIQPLPNHDASYSAAVVITPRGPIVVLGIHPKCCGYIGSSEDLQRISQTQRMAQLVTEVRAGQHNTAVELNDAPVIIGGDWNLVGSRTPLDMLIEPEMPRMAELPMLSAAADVSTWRALNGLGFPPGRLDLIVYDASTLTPTFSEVFDSALLTAERLATLGLQAADSRASDHLMLLADFRFNQHP